MDTPGRPQRISVEEARRRLTAGSPALLVSAYPRKMYDRLHLEGAIPLEDLEGKLAALGTEQEFIFY